MKPTTVDEYIQSAPKETQAKLHALRKAIKEAAPDAYEKLSYGMPYYGYKGRLAYFAYAKNHVGLYVMPPIVEQHNEELTDYKTAKATIRFPLDKDLPLPLIKKLIKAGVHANEIKHHVMSQRKDK